MKHMLSLICAIEYVEANLRNDIRVASVSAAAFVSISHLQRIFVNAFHCSIGDYITKRRLCGAAQALLQTDQSITTLALEYGYSSTESFSRAFKKQFRKSPSVFRKENRFAELYPKLIPIAEQEGRGFMIRKYDITELSEKILAAKGTYIIHADIDHLLHINNNLGRDAGDIAIAESAARFERSIGASAAFFRIGADEFVILTGSTNLAEAERVAQSILSYANDELPWKNGTFKFSLSLGISLIPINCTDALAALAKSDAAMYEAKRNGRNGFVVM